MAETASKKKEEIRAYLVRTTNVEADVFGVFMTEEAAEAYIGEHDEDFYVDSARFEPEGYLGDDDDEDDEEDDMV